MKFFSDLVSKVQRTRRKKLFTSKNVRITGDLSYRTGNDNLGNDADWNHIAGQIDWMVKYLSTDLGSAFAAFLDDVGTDRGYSDISMQQAIHRVKTTNDAVPVNLANDFRDWLSDAVNDKTADYAQDQR
tara:strand:+ start:976 stop:1362 length:387 start_codon:yes stop_codon:yes gene_type:complete